jgi:hypothetical protein
MTDPGFVVVDTTRFFERRPFCAPGPGPTSLPFHAKQWRRFPELARYACWLEALLAAALPEESAPLAVLEYRHEQAGFADAEVDRLHADGSYVRAVCPLFGPATVFRDGDTLRPVPLYHTLFMTATDRARARGVSCTLHRRPGAGPERAVIVCSYAPRPEQSQLANNCRRAAFGDGHGSETTAEVAGKRRCRGTQHGRRPHRAPRRSRGWSPWLPSET